MFTFSVKHVPSWALNVLVSSTERLILSLAPNVFASLVFIAKWVHLHCQHIRFQSQTISSLAANVLVSSAKSVRSQRKRTIDGFYTNVHVGCWSLQAYCGNNILGKNIFAKKVIPYRPTRLFQYKTTGNKKYFGSALICNLYIYV